MNKNSLAKIIAIIGSAAVVLHLIIFAFYRYDIIRFFIILGIIYLTIPLMKRIKSGAPQ